MSSNASSRPGSRPGWLLGPGALAVAVLASALGLGVAASSVAGGAIPRAVAASSVSGQDPSPDPGGDPAGQSRGLLPDGRKLSPKGAQVELGNYPTGGALTADGRFLWTVSTGPSSNDVRIVDTRSNQVCQVLELPGASGGIALDSRNRIAYVSGLANSRWQPGKNAMAGARGDVILVYRWTATCGQAALVRTIAVPPQAGAPTVQAFPPPKQGLAATTTSWPQKLAVSPDGKWLLVPLNLANSAAVVDLTQADLVRYVPTGSYPFGAAVSPDSRLGLVSNEAAGTVSVIDLRRGVKTRDITVGPPLSHPQGIVVDARGRRAYVALSASDQVVVIDLHKGTVERTIWVGRTAGLGTMPVSVAMAPDGDRLFVAESGADEIAVIRLPGATTRKRDRWTVIGRIPTSDQPQAVLTARAYRGGPARLAYVTAEAMGVGSNPSGPNPLLASDPIYWGFSPFPPKTDPFAGIGYLPNLVHGRAGLMQLPSDRTVRKWTPAASKQLRPTNAQRAPEGTPLRAAGPIKHVFFLVRENRSYDQVLGDDPRGNGDPKLALFGPMVTPNLHALVRRFPLLDNVYANSEASIQGHYWTSAASVPDYVARNWTQRYAGRGRPNDFGAYAVTWPGNGFLFDRARRDGVSYFNYGEAFMGGYAEAADRDRSAKQLKEIKRVQAHSDLGPPFAGCYPSDLSIGTAMDNGEIFDSSLPVGAPAGSHSHVDCFRARFAAQVASGAVPEFNYLTLTSDHTRGTQPGFPTPTAMVADSDLAVGQIIETISHSPVWTSSAIFVVEDDSQDGADHVDAHRIPVAVVSPYARAAAVVHTHYDLLSAVRSMELILGMDALTLNDALATPMYDAFGPTAVNPEPVVAIAPQVELLARNTATSPDAQWSSHLALSAPDQVSQAKLDAILWHSVRGAGTAPPPPGPGAEGEE